MTDTLLPASVLILVVALLRRVLRGRVSPRVQYALWLLVAARLLLPGPLFPAPVSVAGAAEELRGVFQAERGDAPTVELQMEPAERDAAFSEETPGGDPPAPSAARPYGSESSGGGWLELVRRAGTALAGGVLVLSNLAFFLRIRKTRRRLTPAEARQAGNLRIYEAEGLPSPCLFGLFRPAVYLNEAALASGRLDHILTHEYTHFRHGDHIWAVVRSVCLVLHWYNPLVWWAAILSRRDCELACDEDAIRRLGEEARIDYGQTLLEMVAAKSAAGDFFHTATTMTAGRRTMAERIALIAHRPRTVRTALAALAAVMCCAVVVTFGGRAQAAPEPRPEPASPPAAGSGAVQPDPGGRPEDAGDPRTLSDPAYVHPSGLFSLTVPEEWLGAVLCVESEDGAAFYDAGRYEEGSGAGWLMSAVPQPVSWAAQHNQNDFLLEEFSFGGSPYVYVLDVDQDPDEAVRSLAPLSVQEDVAGSFRLLADRESVPRLVHGSFGDNMPLALAYLPYLRWSDYREIYGEEEMWALLDALSAFVRDSDVSWGQVHDILSNRSRGDPAIDGAYATAIEEGVLWPLYEKNPQRFASVVGSVYLTDEERADVADWLRYLLSEQAGRVNDVEDYLTDEEVYAALGLAVLPGVSANVSDVTLRASGDTFSFLPVDVPGIYAVSYASDDPDVADVANVSDGTVIAVGPGQTTVRMHVECSGGPYDFACTVRCVWEWEGEDYTASPQIGDQLETTFAVMDSLN